MRFAGDVAAVAFGDDVFAHRFDGFAGDDLVADGGLDGDFEHLARDQFLHFGGDCPAFCFGGFAVQNQRERVNLFAGNQNVELDEIAFDVARKMIIERRIAFGNAFKRS